MVRLGAGSWLNLFCSISLGARFWHILVSLWAPESQGARLGLLRVHTLLYSGVVKWAGCVGDYVSYVFGLGCVKKAN
jgi:hypothetical protein